MTATLPILVWVRDLFFRAKIEGTARHLGVALRCSAEPVALPDGEFGALIVDLEAANDATFTALAAVAPRHRTLGFLSHVHAELAARATAAGCQEVLPRSRFSAELPQLLRRLAGGGA